MSTFNLIITAESLARQVGVVDDEQQEISDVARNVALKRHLGVLQSKPRVDQTKIHSELAAKYLPALATKFRQSNEVVNPAMTILNVISYTPYFIRFIHSPAGQGMAALQTKRTADAISAIDGMDPDTVAEVGQFLATLLLLQGITEIDEADKTALVPKLKQWERRFRGRLASDTSDRCLALITDDPALRPMMQSVKSTMEGSLRSCGAQNCNRSNQSDGSTLMQCSRCKTALYCGTAHQKQSWSNHKALCFATSF